MPDLRQTGARAGRRGLVAAVLLIVASACGGGAATPTPVPATAPPSPTFTDTTPRGGAAVYAVASDVESWDPCYTPGDQTVSEALTAVYGGLMYTDTSGVVQPGMARSLTATDALDWTLKLRDGVKFTDGSPLDAGAVVYNWARVADPASACTQQKWVSSWVSVTATDHLTVTIKLAAPDSGFATKIAEWLPFIGAPTSLKAATSRAHLMPVGAGPFTLASWTPGLGETFDRNAGYWDQPRPYLDRLYFKVIADTTGRVAAIASGVADYTLGNMSANSPANSPIASPAASTSTSAASPASSPAAAATSPVASTAPSSALPAAASASASTAVTPPGVTIHTIAAPGLDLLWFNTKGGVTGLMNDFRAREAVVEGVDAAKLAAALTGDPAARAPGSLYSTSSPYYDPGLVYPSYDRAATQALIDQVRGTGRKFEFTIVTPDRPDTVRAGVNLAQAMNSYTGVYADLVFTPPANWFDVCMIQASMDVCLAPNAQTFSNPEITGFADLSTDGTFNIAHHSDLTLDMALGTARAAVTDSQKVAAYRTVEQIYLRQLPFWAYGVEYPSLLTRDNLGGVTNYSQAGTRVDLLFRCVARCG